MQAPEIVLEHVAKSIKRRIEDAGYPSIDKFCNELGLHKSTLYRTVNRARSPKLHTLVEIANALDIDLKDLLDLDHLNPSGIARMQEIKKNPKRISKPKK